MASDLSGYQGAAGKQRWMQESGGDENAYNRENSGWQQAQAPQQQAPQQSGWHPPQAPQATPQTGGWQSQAQGAGKNQSQSTGGTILPQGASGYNAADVTAYRNIDPNIVRNMTPDQRAEWSMQNIDDLSAHGDATRGKAQWMEWQKSYDPNCPPSNPYKAEDGSGCVEKPDNSNNPSPGGGGGGEGGQGGGGQGGGGGYGAGGGGGWDNPIYQYMRSSNLAAANNPELQMSNFMGQGGARGYQQQIDQARAKVSSMAPGPARDAAMARLEEQKFSGMGGMRQDAAKMQRDESERLLNPEQFWGGNMEMSQRQLGENARQANMADRLGWFGANTSRDLGFGNLGLGYGQLNENARQANQSQGFSEWAQRGDWNQANQSQAAARAAQQPSSVDKWGQALGTAANLAGQYMDYRKNK